jgi:hypothetical protein
MTDGFVRALTRGGLYGESKINDVIEVSKNEINDFVRGLPDEQRSRVAAEITEMMMGIQQEQEPAEAHQE